MERKHFSPILVALAILILVVLLWIGVQFFFALQASPASQFALARHRWETNAIAHYRMNASYYGHRSQCYYDIEVLQGRVVRTFTSGCLGNGDSKNFTVDGIFKNFERYANQRVCSPNGCYCEGNYVVRAIYEETLGHPQRITTVFRRDTLNDLFHGKLGVQQCLRTDPVVERFDRIKITILP
ncbi:MAG TPA: hypothetical protein VFR47_19140 [Anaerolineales bacterium]|nr:hypothetical protein [Anaerolineales bacterium]